VDGEAIAPRCLEVVPRVSHPALTSSCRRAASVRAAGQGSAGRLGFPLPPLGPGAPLGDLTRADHALYRAKAAGRDRVEVADREKLDVPTP